MFRRPRAPIFPSVQDFIQTFNIHKWSFLRAKKKMSTEELQQFVQAIEKEAVIFRTAWEGGDEYMQVLANWIEGSMERHADRDPLEKAALAFVNAQGEEFTKYLTDLRFHDWYYRESDDVQVYRRGKAREDELAEIAERGGIWKQAFEIERTQYYKPAQKAALVTPPKVTGAA